MARFHKSPHSTGSVEHDYDGLISTPVRDHLRCTHSRDSISSTESVERLSEIGEDVCRCDDCLLAIVDSYVTCPEHVKNKSSDWLKLRKPVQSTPFCQAYRKQNYRWIQLAGHQGIFKAGPEQGTVLKKLCPKEKLCYQNLKKDILRPYVPEYRGQVTSEDGELYIQLEDLLSDFSKPCIMDCKIGVRTYLEEELSKAKSESSVRRDLYEKMVEIDPNAPNKQEHKAKGVTRHRYMVWRENTSSTVTFGFRIEGIRKWDDDTCSKDLRTIKSREQVKKYFREFIRGFPHALPRYIQRLRAIQATLQCSNFFKNHEVIGSSLLFIHDHRHASVWLIDFAKTVMAPDNYRINHRSTWTVGNHEDGYLIGTANLIKIFCELQAELGMASNFPVLPVNVFRESVTSLASRGSTSETDNFDETSDSATSVATEMCLSTFTGVTEESMATQTPKFESYMAAEECDIGDTQVEEKHVKKELNWNTFFKKPVDECDQCENKSQQRELTSQMYKGDYEPPSESSEYDDATGFTLESIPEVETENEELLNQVSPLANENEKKTKRQSPSLFKKLFG